MNKLLAMHTLASLACALIPFTSVSAQQPAAPAGFRHERAVIPAAAGPQRLAIDVPLLAGLFSSNDEDEPGVSRSLARKMGRAEYRFPVWSGRWEAWNIVFRRGLPVFRRGISISGVIREMGGAEYRFPERSSDSSERPAARGSPSRRSRSWVAWRRMRAA